MMPLLTVCGRVLCLLPFGLLVMGCTQSALQAPSPQEHLGMGIVTGTLGAQARSAQSVGEPASGSVVGQVQAVEGGAYLVRDVRGQEYRIPHDENTKIDRPAHVGDRIQSWFDRHGRAVLIRSIEEDGR
ncbi:MAG: hypothetical protein JSR20_04400 [Nitrospira sp.]|nr:hypothetical protein [Nitrospira sp.]MBS0159460.1 hypothetical protein [Nitrospira sp.]MBS0177985.1 hypothetical protein [Nitrospira sp.]MCC7471983.1 hypothetical protein [Candidatus Nomurabacteria bacterium]